MGSTKISILCFSYFLMCYFLSAVGEEMTISTEKRLPPPPPPPPHFVLVHGFNSGAWTWYKVKALLETHGYKVTCLDLKGAGVDTTNSSTVRTFTSYNEPLVKFMRNLSPHEKVILVGSSAGGLSVTDISHKFSEKIKVAVYIAATMLKQGFVTKKDLLDGKPAFGGGVKADPKHDHPPCIPVPPEGRSLADLLARHPVPQEAILSAKFEGDEADKVRRVYIKTLCDDILLPKQQAAMIKRWPPAEVIELKADHIVTSSDPFIIFGILYKIAISLDHSN